VSPRVFVWKNRKGHDDVAFSKHARYQRNYRQSDGCSEIRANTQTEKPYFNLISWCQPEGSLVGDRKRNLSAISGAAADHHRWLEYRHRGPN
jgi:hypothetical protein